MKTALVTVCLNHLDITKKFLESVESELDNSYELFILDNGSCDGTFEYLEELSKKESKVKKHVYKSKLNLGFAGGNNLLLKEILKTANEYSNVILINNDTIVTKESLDLLVNICNSSEDIGATGPVSNYVAGMQCVSIKGLTPENYTAYAKQLAKSTEIHTEEIGTLIGFCMCIKMSALKETGLLDEQFGVGMYEDNDYSLRLRNNGYRLLFVKQSLIYHFGSQTIKDFDMNDLLIVNREKFIKKHMLNDVEPKICYIDADNKSQDEIRNTIADFYRQGFKWVCFFYENEDATGTLGSEGKIYKMLLNADPSKDLFKFKILHINPDTKTIDLSDGKGSDWQGRVLRIRQRIDGSFMLPNEAPKDTHEYCYIKFFDYGKPHNTVPLRVRKDIIAKYSTEISASYIVKNENKYIRQSLESIKDLVDEIVIVDTGSTDSTKEICKQYTDKIYDYKWNDSFADARNFSLDKCTGNWILRLDGDEIVPKETAVNIYNAIMNQEGDMYMLPIKNIQPDGSAPISMTLRVFRNVPGLKYTGRVHEEISESAKKLGLKMLKINNHLMHYGYLKGTQAKKTDMYFKLLMLDYQDNPKDSATCMNLANHYVHQGQYETAISFYKECIECLNDKIDPIIYHDYGVALYKLFLSKHQPEIKEMLAVLDKVKQTIGLCYPEQKERFSKNYNIISNMILTK